jgi:ABC-type lipoprotein release transport system permease subunit
MKSVAFKNIWAHKFRILSLFCIIAAGTGFIAGALVLGATMTRTFNDLFGSVFANTDAVVRAKAPFDSGNGNADATRPPVPAALLGQVEQVPDVAAAVGNVTITAQAVDAQGNVVSTGGAPNFGFNWTDETWANPYRIAEGTPPQADDQVVIDRGIAKKGKLHVGEEMQVLSAAGSEPFTISGIATFGSVDSAAGSTAIMFTTPTVQRLAEAAGRAPDTYDNISVKARDGVSQTEVRDEITSAVATDSSIEVLTGEEVIKENEDAINDFLKVFTIILLVFAGVAVVVGMFVIYNTFGILVAQRTRETALLRALGASAGQILRSVVVESSSSDSSDRARRAVRHRARSGAEGGLLGPWCRPACRRHRHHAGGDHRPAGGRRPHDPRVGGGAGLAVEPGAAARRDSRRRRRPLRPLGRPFHHRRDPAGPRCARPRRWPRRRCRGPRRGGIPAGDFGRRRHRSGVRPTVDPPDRRATAGHSWHDRHARSRERMQSGRTSATAMASPSASPSSPSSS